MPTFKSWLTAMLVNLLVGFGAVWSLQLSTVSTGELQREELG